MSSTESMATPGLAHVADDARVVAVVAAVGGEVEGHRQPHLPGGQVGPVEGVRLLGGGEAGVLADRPGPVRVHRRPDAAHERVEAGEAADRLEPFEVVSGVEGTNVDALGGVPGQGVEVALDLLPCECLPVGPCRTFAVTHAEKGTAACRAEVSRSEERRAPSSAAQLARSSCSSAASSARRALATPSRPTRRVPASRCQSPQEADRRPVRAGFVARPRRLVVFDGALGGRRAGTLGRARCRAGTRLGGFDEAQLRGHMRSITGGCDSYSAPYT